MPPGEAVGAGLDAFRRHTAAVAAVLREHCLDVNLAPVAERSSGDRRGWRSASGDIAEAAAYATAFAEGMKEGGVAPTFKHFPGRTANLVYDATPKDRLWSFLRLPTESVVVLDEAARPDGRGGAPALTVRDAAAAFRGVRFPALVMKSLNRHPEYGEGMAAASPLFERWLREDIGFDGVTVSDSLSEVDLGRDLVVDAFRNNDLVLVTGGMAYAVEEHLLAALADGTVRRSEFAPKRERIARVLEWVRSQGGRP